MMDVVNSGLNKSYSSSIDVTVKSAEINTVQYPRVVYRILVENSMETCTVPAAGSGWTSRAVVGRPLSGERRAHGR